MALFALIIGLVLIVSAVRNSQDALFSALFADVPKFMVWGFAIVAIGAIGFVPGLKPTSRLLLGLIIIVLFVNNYKQISSGFSNAWQASGAATSSTSGAATSSTSGAATSSTSALPINPSGIENYTGTQSFLE